VLYPEISYRPMPWAPPWRAPLRRGAGGDGAGGGLDLRAIDPDDARRALLLWVNSPSNPTGALSDLDEAASWGHEHDVLVFSDECYAEFTWAGPPRSVLETAARAWSPSTPSPSGSKPGWRARWLLCGDPDIVSYLRDVRQHAGLMCRARSGGRGRRPRRRCERDAQRERYFQRLGFMGKVLADAGCPVALPEGGSISGCPCPSGSTARGSSPPTWRRPRGCS